MTKGSSSEETIENVVTQLRAAAGSVRQVRTVLEQLIAALHRTPTSYNTRVKVTNYLDAANNKLNQAALAFDHEADVQAITQGIVDG